MKSCSAILLSSLVIWTIGCMADNSVCWDLLNFTVKMLVNWNVDLYHFQQQKAVNELLHFHMKFFVTVRDRAQSWSFHPIMCILLPVWCNLCQIYVKFMSDLLKHAYALMWTSFHRCANSLFMPCDQVVL